MTYAVEVSVENEEWRDLAPELDRLCERVAEAVLSAEFDDIWRGRTAAPVVEVGVVLGDDAMLRDLNRRYRGKDKATNVLSFGTVSDAPKADLRETADPLILLGDIYLALETVMTEAAGQGKPPIDHMTHLIVHGLLHLAGYDHEQAADADAMERREIELLSGIGVGNPYLLENC